MLLFAVISALPLFILLQVFEPILHVPISLCWNLRIIIVISAKQPFSLPPLMCSSSFFSSSLFSFSFLFLFSPGHLSLSSSPHSPYFSSLTCTSPPSSSSFSPLPPPLPSPSPFYFPFPSPPIHPPPPTSPPSYFRHPLIPLPHLLLFLLLLFLLFKQEQVLLIKCYNCIKVES